MNPIEKFYSGQKPKNLNEKIDLLHAITGIPKSTLYKTYRDNVEGVTVPN